MREVLKVVLFMGAIIVFCALVMWLLLRDVDAAVPETWSVPTAVDKGMKWGGGKKHVKGVKKMVRLHYPLYWNYGGGVDMGTLGLLTWTETGHLGNPLASTNDTTLGEACLLSVKRAYAKTLDVDVCDPKQCVWAAAHMRHERMERLKVNQPWVENLSTDDRAFYSGMLGGAGGGAAACAMKGSDAKAILKGKKWKGSLKNLVLDWFRTKGDALKDEQFDACWGRTNAETAAFRMARIHAVRKVVIKAWGGGKDGKARRDACTRPVSLAIDKPAGWDNQYPGDEAHGKCDPTPKKTWAMPPAGHRYAWKGKKKRDLWGPFCDDVEPCTFDEAWDGWVDAKQAQGLLPSDDEYAQARLEMEADGCDWMLE